MKIRIILSLLFFCFFIGNAQKKEPAIKWLRTGFVYGFSSQNTYIPQDSDYRYENQSIKFSNHFLLSKSKKHSWEISVEPSYYKSKHESFNSFHPYFTNSENSEEELAKFLPLKDINEYVLNLGIVYRYYLKTNLSAYALGNVGPMYIDTDTERLKKGLAFSDIFALGINYKQNALSFDVKTTIRHISNANIKYPNFGYNAVGFEFGCYYEFTK